MSGIRVLVLRSTTRRGVERGRVHCPECHPRPSHRAHALNRAIGAAEDHARTFHPGRRPYVEVVG